MLGHIAIGSMPHDVMLDRVRALRRQQALGAGHREVGEREPEQVRLRAESATSDGGAPAMAPERARVSLR